MLAQASAQPAAGAQREGVRGVQRRAVQADGSGRRQQRQREREPSQAGRFCQLQGEEKHEG